MLPFAGPILIATLWQGAALALLVVLCLRLIPQTTAALRFLLWTATLLLICLLPFAAVSTSLNTHRSMLHADYRWSLALAALWVTLSLVRAIDLARNAVRLRYLSRQAKPIAVDHPMATIFRSHRRAQLCTSTQLERPGVIGFFHPRILIPARLFAQLTAPELEQIVLHELEHLRRRDDWLNLLQKLALVLFPLNPVLYWIERRLCFERELACDEGVVRRTQAPRLYATCLTRLAEHGLDHRVLSLALGFIERQSELARRVASILNSPHTLSRRQNLALTGTVAALLLGGSAELSRCPPLIFFTAAPSALASSDIPHLAPKTWLAMPSARPVLYTDALPARFIRTSLVQNPKRVFKTKLHRSHPPIAAQRAFTEQAAPAELFTMASTQSAPLPTTSSSTLVRYTLVRVAGGWLLLQL